MKRALLIIYSGQDSTISKFEHEIKKLGDNHLFYKNHWLVITDLTAQETYKKLSERDFKSTPFIVFEINNPYNNCEGCISFLFWEWLEKYKYLN